MKVRGRPFPKGMIPWNKKHIVRERVCRTCTGAFTWRPGKGLGLFCSVRCKNQGRTKALDMEAIIQRLLQGETQTVIAQEVGVEPSVLSRRLKATGFRKATKGLNYRRIKLRAAPARCEICGWDRFPQLLKVHHKDGDRTRNMNSNLAVLCPVCHDLCHLTAGGVNHAAMPRSLEEVRQMLTLPREPWPLSQPSP